MSVTPDKEESGMRHLTEAAAWRIRLIEDGVTSSVDFETWLKADAANAAAWDCVQAPLDLLDELAAVPELIEVRQGALRRARDAGRRKWPPRRIVGMAAAGLASVTLVAGVISWQLSRPDLYRTAPGEGRVVMLEDGSRVALDSATRVRVKYSKQARDLWLESGQARFDVAHDPQRPFSVAVANEKILATGTAFNIDMMGSQIRVTLIEGRVVVIDHSTVPSAGSREAANSTTGTGARRIELHAGEQLLAVPSAAPSVERVNVEHATAWQSGQLVFDNETLAVVLERVGRYTSRPLRVDDERAANLRINGVFHAGDLDGFVDVITQYLPVSVQSGDDGTLVFRSHD